MTTQTMTPSLDVSMSDVDIDAIDDEDVLKQMVNTKNSFKCKVFYVKLNVFVKTVAGD